MAQGGTSQDLCEADSYVEEIEREAERKVLNANYILNDVKTGQPRIIVNNASMVTTGDITIHNNYGRSSHKPKKSKHSKPLTTSTAVPSTEALSHISERLGCRWKQVGRSLGFEDAMLEQIELDYYDSVERNYQMLRKWRDKEGSGATKAKLAQKLDSCYFGKLSDYLAD